MDYKLYKGDHEVIECMIHGKRGKLSMKIENIKLQDVRSKWTQKLLRKLHGRYEKDNSEAANL